MDGFSIAIERKPTSPCIEKENESPLNSESGPHSQPHQLPPIQQLLQSVHGPHTTTASTASDDGEMFLRRILTGGGGLAALRAARAVKETTGIVGLEVVPNAREVLIGLYTRTLKEIEAAPKDEGYRKAVESFTNHRLQICQEEDDWKRIEDRIGCGQVEELIEEAEDELKLIAKMIEWDPWGVPDDYECEVIEDDTPIPKHVPQHRPVALPEEFFKTLDAVKSDPALQGDAPPQVKA